MVASRQRTREKEDGIGEVDSSLWRERLEEGISKVREELEGRPGSSDYFRNPEDC